PLMHPLGSAEEGEDPAWRPGGRARARSKSPRQVHATAGKNLLKQHPREGYAVPREMPGRLVGITREVCSYSIPGTEGGNREYPVASRVILEVMYAERDRP